MRGATYVVGTKNTKLSGSKPIDATYAAIGSTCSPTCPLQRDKLCYATLSFVGMINRRLEKQSESDSPLEVARAEAKLIDESYDGGVVPTGRALRLHVSGDSRTIAGTKVLNKAVGRWLKGELIVRHIPTHTRGHMYLEKLGRMFQCLPALSQLIK